MAWSFLTTHAQVLICLAQACDADGQAAITTRSIAQQLNLTERQVQRIIDDLCADGYVTAACSDRSNVYAVHRERPLRSALAPGRTVGERLAVVAPGQRADET